MEATEPEGTLPDGHELPSGTNYKAEDIIEIWVGQFGRKYIESGIIATLQDAGYTSIQDMDFDPDELVELGIPRPRARNLWRAMSALRERHLGPGKAIPWPRQTAEPEVVIKTLPWPI